MKTREDFIKNCRYPALPDNSVSSYNVFHARNKGAGAFYGGRLTENISTDSFELSSQFQKIKCFVSENCRLFFHFDKTAKNIIWKEAFSLLKAGDHLMVCASEEVTKKNTKLPEIYNINKVVLLSVNRENTVFSDSFAKAQLHRDWLLFLTWVHQAMARIGLEPVDTSTLVDCPGTEPDLDLFETKEYYQEEFMTQKNGLKKQEKNVPFVPKQELPQKNNKKYTKLFLSTSPEMQMKRLLCRGWTDIYEVKKCFRNNEAGPINSREFYLLEWYRAYSRLEILIEDISFLLNFLSDKMKLSAFPKPRKVSMAELFKSHLGMELRPHSSKKNFIDELDKRNIPYKKSDNIDDLFYLLFLNGIEPYLEPDAPLVVYNYPPFQKAYARIGPEGWASRFELFWKGMELANAFDEVIEPVEQKNRFEEDNFKRIQRGRREVPLAYPLLDDMKTGMPPSAGVALGLERLFLAFKGLDDIQSLKLIEEGKE